MRVIYVEDNLICITNKYNKMHKTDSFSLAKLIIEIVWFVSDSFRVYFYI